MNNLENLKRKFSIAYLFNIGLLVLIIANVASWIYRYGVGHSLWIDEAMLADSVASRNFFGVLTGQFDYGQSAPFVFAVISKINLYIFGQNEYALRLLPLLAAIGSLPMMYVLSMNILKLRFPLLPVAFLASMYLMGQYCFEFKPYSFDVLVALTSLYLYGLYTNKRLKFSTLCIYLAILVWCSLSTLMLIAAISAYLFFKILFDSNNTNRWHKLLTLFIIAISAALCFVLWINPTSQNINESAHEYWQYMNFPLIPTSLAEFYKAKTMIVKFFMIFDIRGIYWASILIILGLIFCKETWYRNIIIICAIFILIGSYLGKFPFAERLWLFYASCLVPLICIAFEKGAEFFKTKSKFGYIAILFCAFCIVGMHTRTDVLRPAYKDGLQYRNCHSWVEEQMANDSDTYEYIRGINRPFTHFYTIHRYPNGNTMEPFDVIEEGRIIWGGRIRRMHNLEPFKYNFEYDQDVLEENADAIAKHNKVYIVSAHEDYTLQPLLDILKTRGKISVPYEFHKTKVYMFEK